MPFTEPYVRFSAYGTVVFYDLYIITGKPEKIKRNISRCIAKVGESTRKAFCRCKNALNDK